MIMKLKENVKLNQQLINFISSKDSYEIRTICSKK